MVRRLGITVIVVLAFVLADCTTSPQSVPNGTVTGRFVAIGPVHRTGSVVTQWDYSSSSV
jgi:hypothetical protein